MPSLARGQRCAPRCVPPLWKAWTNPNWASARLGRRRERVARFRLSSRRCSRPAGPIPHRQRPCRRTSGNPSHASLLVARLHTHATVLVAVPGSAPTRSHAAPARDCPQPPRSVDVTPLPCSHSPQRRPAMAGLLATYSDRQRLVSPEPIPVCRPAPPVCERSGSRARGLGCVPPAYLPAYLPSANPDRTQADGLVPDQRSDRPALAPGHSPLLA